MRRSTGLRARTHLDVTEEQRVQIHRLHIAVEWILRRSQMFVVLRLIIAPSTGTTRLTTRGVVVFHHRRVGAQGMFPLIEMGNNSKLKIIIYFHYSRRGV